MPLRRLRLAPRRVVGAHRQAQAQARRPAMGALQQRAGVFGLGRQAVLGAQGLHLLRAETQLALAELRQLAGGAQPRQRQRRLDPPGQHQAPLFGPAFEHPVQQLEDLRVAETVRVVDDDQAPRQLGRGQRIDQLAGHIAQPAFGLGQRRQRLGRDAPGQVEGFQRGRQAGQKTLKRIVVVGRDPGQRTTRRQLPDLPRQRRRLAVAGRCEQQGQLVLLQRLAERALQGLPLDQGTARPRRLDLGQRKGGGSVLHLHRDILAQAAPRWRAMLRGPRRDGSFGRCAGAVRHADWAKALDRLHTPPCRSSATPT